MRARYTAFVVEDEAYLLSTWHPDTRPSRITFRPDQEWTGLEVVETTAGTMFDDTGTVRFAASFSTPDGDRRLLELSEFARVEGKWTYVAAAEATIVDD
jgi:SEC-C motif-containing protein